jgi:hypothetical protein
MSPLERCDGVVLSERHKWLTSGCGGLMLTQRHTRPHPGYEGTQLTDAPKGSLYSLVSLQQRPTHDPLRDT